MGQTRYLENGKLEARASRVGIPIKGFPDEYERPFAALRAILSPVNEPGPMETAIPSISSSERPASSRIQLMAVISFLEWVVLILRVSSEITPSSSTIAMLPTVVAVSMAMIFMKSVYLRGRL